MYSQTMEQAAKAAAEHADMMGRKVAFFAETEDGYITVPDAQSAMDWQAEAQALVYTYSLSTQKTHKGVKADA